MARRAKPKKLKYKKPVPARRRYYGKGYSRKKSWVGKFKWPLIAAAVLILLFLIISVAPAFSKFITGQLNDNGTSSADAGYSSSGSDLSSSDMSSGAQFGISGADSLKIAALPIKHYGNDEKISEFLDTAKTEGMTAIAVTIKDDAGKVYFDYEKARGYNATAKKLLDLTRTAALITEKGMTPVAVMDTFKDPIAAASRDNCYMYIDGSSMWLDNTLAAGGKPWLSVYSRSAEKYLLGIEQAAIDAGFKRIILNSVQYPDVRDLTTIKFPEDADDASKLKALGDFVNKAYKKGEEQNVAVSAVFSGEAVLGQKDNIYFGSPFETEALSVSPVIDSSLLSGSVTVGGQRIKNPGDNLDKLLKAIVDAAGGAAVTPVIYAGDEKADELTQAIEQTEGMDGYILYSDDVPEDLSAAYGTEG